MKLAIIILNYKTYKDTIRLVKSLRNESFKDAVIVVVDNKSPNESYTALSNEFIGVDNVDVILSPENGGFAKGNNFGLRYVAKYEPEFVCIVNNDVYFSKQTIEALIDDYSIIKYGAISPIQKLPGDKVALIGNLILPSFKSDFFDYFRVWRQPLHKYVSNTGISNLQKVGLIPGAFIFMKYNIAKEIDFFDECTFLYCEESFLSQRLKSKGYSCYIDINQTYIHEHSKTISSEKSQKQQDMLIRESRLKYLLKYEKNPRIKYLILSIVSILSINIKYLIKKVIR